VLPVQINLGAYKLAKQNNLFATMYHELMVDNNDKVMDKINKALKEIGRYKARVAHAYNKEVKGKSF
jgi:hypothetical protein